MTMRGVRRGAALVVVLLVAVTLRPKSGSESVPLPPTAKPQDTTTRVTIVAPVSTPAHGSAQRTALLDAVRRELKTSSRFRVDHVRVAGRWGFLRATEVVPLERGEQQETDLTIAALLELPTGSQSWRVIDYWTLPGENERPLAAFKARVAERLRVERLSPTLLPGDL